MSELPSSFPPVIEAELPHQPGVWVVRPPKPRWWLYWLFLFLTLFSTMVVGARMQANFLRQLPVFSLADDTLSLFPIGWIAQHPANLLMGLPFSLTLMFILFAHEMGHYLYARHYNVYVTPPFFVPCPYLSLFGTLGAFIRIKSPIPSRAALFDIGVAGPIAGFIPACAALLYGLSLSNRAVVVADTELQLGFPLVFRLGARLLHLGAPLDAMSLHPIAAAAWVGMFATALNLLPAGQLDGGHIIFSLSPRLHRTISFLAVIALVPLAKYFWLGWLIWAVLLTLTMRHPRVQRYPEVSGNRRIVALFAALILVLSFTPAPIQASSGREAWQKMWPDFRDASRDKLHGIGHRVHHFLHSK
jgi:Zn-dependent protease